MISGVTGAGGVSGAGPLQPAHNAQQVMENAIKTIANSIQSTPDMTDSQVKGALLVGLSPFLPTDGSTEYTSSLANLEQALGGLQEGALSSTDIHTISTDLDAIAKNMPSTYSGADITNGMSNVLNQIPWQNSSNGPTCLFAKLQDFGLNTSDAMTGVQNVLDSVADNLPPSTASTTLKTNISNAISKQELTLPPINMLVGQSLFSFSPTNVSGAENELNTIINSPNASSEMKSAAQMYLKAAQGLSDAQGDVTTSISNALLALDQSLPT